MASSWKGTMGAMLAGGVIGVLLAPVLAPVIARYGRPAGKAAIKAGIMLYRRGREAAAELVEAAEDLAAETKAELTSGEPTPPSHEAATAAPSVH